VIVAEVLLWISMGLFAICGVWALRDLLGSVL
jgi:hypothetical protein